VLHQLSTAKPAADAIVELQLDSWPASKTGAEADLARLREVAKLLADIPCPDVARQAARLRDHLPFDDKTVARELADAVTTARTVGVLGLARHERPRTARPGIRLASPCARSPR
jgi:hypothetical protein